MALRIDTLLDRKRSGKELTAHEMTFFVECLMDNRLTHAQVGAFCAFTMWRGMTQAETVALGYGFVEDLRRFDGKSRQPAWGGV